MFPPEIVEKDGVMYSRIASQSPAIDSDVVTLQESMETAIDARSACSTGICRVREDIFAEAFLEIIRQVSVSCNERGMLLWRIKNELEGSIDEYRKLHASAVRFRARNTPIEGDEGLTVEREASM